MDVARRFSTAERTALYLASDAKCAGCAGELGVGWHGDHQLAFVMGGETDVVNGDALCERCNLARGAVDARGERARSLREWQRRALDAYEAALPRDFLAVATPGAGKTTLAAAVAGRHLRAGRAQLVVVVVPTERLKAQWADAVAPNGVQLAPDWSNSDGALPRDFDGVAVTYAQVAAQPDLFRRHVSRQSSLVVLDEIHHCGESRSWGDAVRHGFEPATWRVALSGTPFRSDNNSIPFVRYVDGVGQPDVAYDYREAITDGVCRAVFFPRRGGRMEWATASGDIVRATFEDDLADGLVNQRLRTALSLKGEWLPAVIADAHAELVALRQVVPDAGGLVIASDQEHARNIAGLMRDRHGVEAVLVVSDEPSANERIEAFSEGDAPWLIAVRMVSEGVDIPRLRVAVYAATITSELFFRQAVGRVVRVIEATAGETASFYIPDDPRLRRYAATIREQRDHVLDSDVDALLDLHESGGGNAAPASSSFVPIAAEPLDVGGTFDGAEFTAGELKRAAALKLRAPLTAVLPTAVVAAVLRLAGDGASVTHGPALTQEPVHRRRKALRAANNLAARRLAFATGGEYADVNRRLNESVRIRTVSEATVDELVERLRNAQAWMPGVS